MQIVKQSNIEKRILYYWSRLYIGEIHEGDNYNNLNKTIAILIADFELDKIKDIPKSHTKWEIREEEYSKKVLTDMLEIHIIELPKLLKAMENKMVDKKDKLAIWSKFLLSPDEVGEEDMENNEDIKKAKNELSKIQQDERERELARLRMKHIMDQKAIKDYGYQEGQAEGKKQEKLEIAKKLLKMAIPIGQIMQATELTKEEIENLDK